VTLDQMSDPHQIADSERTITLIRDCWKCGYEKVTIEDEGQQVYAFPSFVTFRKEKRGRLGFAEYDLTSPPLWSLCRTILGKDGCTTGSGQSSRGDRAQNGSGIFLIPGVYIKGLGHPILFPDDNSIILAVELKLDGRSIQNSIWCSHGRRLKPRETIERTKVEIARKKGIYTGCDQKCFDNWKET
jgi:hypothetical protein